MPTVAERSPQFWRHLAHAYDEAIAEGTATSVAVVKYLADLGWPATRQQATAYWVRKARTLGYLEPTKRGATQPHSDRLTAVAHALGVDVAELEGAIREFANGRLTVR